MAATSQQSPRNPWLTSNRLASPEMNIGVSQNSCKVREVIRRRAQGGGGGRVGGWGKRLYITKDRSVNIRLEVNLLC